MKQQKIQRQKIQPTAEKRTLATTKNIFRHKAGEYRSGLENLIKQQLDKAHYHYSYEPGRIEYITKPRHYTPDFVLENGIIIETKGYFLSQDRTKHLAIQKQHPDMDIRFVFQNPNTRLSKTSKITYAQWCVKNGFKYAVKTIPDEWLKEKPRKETITANKEIK